jgi:rhamnose utilization protein RhaD (predicted bifunctional aldolase and dehydrogenase)
VFVNMDKSEAQYQYVENLSSHAQRLGSDISYVQGPGGNVSFKVNGVLWIKASGKKMSSALCENIFVSLDLAGAAELALLDDSSKMLEAVLPGSPIGLRPSIETAMHAVISSPVVSHVHSVGSVAVGVLQNSDQALEAVEDFAPIAKIPYVRPGAPLARAILDVLEPHHKGLLLGNHGLTVWGDTFVEAENLIAKIESVWRSGATDVFPDDMESSAGICSPEWSQKLCQGVLVPDEAVLLGARPFGNSSAACSIRIDDDGETKFEIAPTHDARDIARMLVAVGQHVPTGAELNYLSDSEVADLLNWDMEKFRQEMST